MRVKYSALINKVMILTGAMGMVLAFAPILYAAQVGKLAGRITDDESGDPLVGVNVVIEDTRLGAATDLAGEYFILNVSTGRYTVRVSAVGFVAQNVVNVEIASGKTTRLNLALRHSFLPMEEVTVVWEKPPVDLQETSMRATVRQETIESLPVQTVDQILELQAGAVTDADGELHLRGGRTGEIVYYVDGQRIEDPLTGESSLFIHREAIEELTLLSGTFNAEYGDAMSGIVQVITREGGKNFRWSFEYLSPMLNNSPYRQADWVQPLSDSHRDADENSLYEPENVWPDETDGLLDDPLSTPGRLQMSIGGPVNVLNNASYFVSSVVRNENSHLPFGYEQERAVQGKLAWAYGSGGKITLSGGYGWQDNQDYSHYWKYQPDHYHKHFIRDQRAELQWTHSTSKNFFFNVFSGYHYNRHDAKVFEEWEDYLDAGYQQKDFTYYDPFYEVEDWSDLYSESRTTTYSLGANASYQYGNHHLLKSGVERRLLEIDMLDISELEISVDNQPTGIVDIYEENPIELAAYVQDRIELPYLVVNAGLRWDWVDPRSEGWADPEHPDSGLAETEPEQQLSPRLGLAHPITDDISLYFAYGHFFQYPHYSTLFMNTSYLDTDTLANRSRGIVGNRMLKAQRTAAYEVGLKGNLTDVLGFTVTAYYKDITDLVGSKQVRVGTMYNYGLFRNIDYASVVGVELGLRRNLVDNWSFEGNYTYSVAKGNSSEPTVGYWDAYYQAPEVQQEYYLDFDRRHVFNAMFIYQTGDLTGENFLNILASDITLGVVATWASGLPYTPYTGLGEQLAVTNSARMDPTATVDLRFSKALTRRPVEVTLLAYVDNLFDLVNPLEVNSRTGEPWESPLEGNEFDFDFNHDPSKVDVPRTIKVGISARF